MLEMRIRMLVLLLLSEGFPIVLEVLINYRCSNFRSDFRPGSSPEQRQALVLQQYVSPLLLLLFSAFGMI